MKQKTSLKGLSYYLPYHLPYFLIDPLPRIGSFFLAPLIQESPSLSRLLPRKRTTHSYICHYPMFSLVPQKSPICKYSFFFFFHRVIKRAFELAIEKKPSILFIDEIETLHFHGNVFDFQIEYSFRTHC